MHKKSRKERKRLLIITIVIISLLTLLIGSVYKDWQQIMKNRRTENELAKQYEKLLEDETKLNAEITKLEDKEYLQRYAKEKYMLSKEGDIIIKMD